MVKWINFTKQNIFLNFLKIFVRKRHTESICIIVYVSVTKLEPFIVFVLSRDFV